MIEDPAAWARQQYFPTSPPTPQPIGEHLAGLQTIVESHEITLAEEILEHSRQMFLHGGAVARDFREELRTRMLADQNALRRGRLGDLPDSDAERPAGHRMLQRPKRPLPDPE